jgi:hypothetical protein
VAAGGSAAPAHSGVGGGSPMLGGPGAPVQQTRQGKRQNSEGMTPNSPRRSVLSRKRQFRLVATTFFFASGRSVWSAPPRSSIGYEE